VEVLAPLLLIVAVIVGILVTGWFIWWRYRERQRESWPISTATIETGSVEVRKQESAVIALLLGHPVCPPPLVLLLGYCFAANGSSYSGKTAISARGNRQFQGVQEKIQFVLTYVRGE
jgi:hypothetical protein